MRWFNGFLGKVASSRFLCECHKGVNYQQKFGLVNVKLKWVKDKSLDAVVAGERDLRAACILVSVISSLSHHFVPIYHLCRHRGQLNLPQDLKLSTFIRKYPTIFHESHVLDSGGTRVPAFGLTPEAVDLHQEELNVIQQSQKDIIDRLCKLLMLTKHRILPLQTIDQLKWDMGLPYDYQDSVVPHHPGLFSVVHLPDDRLGLKLLFWDDHLAVSQLRKSAVLQQKETDIKNNCLAFPIRFTRGFGLKRKCMKWLEEWQRLPYTSPYTDASHLDPRTDESEKRIVGVFHELLHLTIQKKTERKNVSNLRKPLSLPQKFTNVFERHPGIFYISKKGDTQTVVLREAYDHQQLLQKNPLVDIRERFASLMSKGFLEKSRGLYKKMSGADLENPSKLVSRHQLSGIGYSSELELDCILFSDYESDDPAHCAS
ncbi:protein WHAT'S THIS FACTOR 9, mitochondrial [Pistacia vera]|uniref:protein WHAT'S THIS FACTOR 9, mitochondrial n=1 Tax=Pistacia vera TaxID=55513 RepID=UPI00126377E4|nr:protein WHAT'S THIS FACTOR 9, mitochondrial [Pistacia vera]XP_031256715.1 protein WHAT'S THIS FACTOR 9, mitochondrial [Pistacia vera]XP_031256716.1 protein WHAT'S THIS FACTOR 9, mitochondrial [Pistacia vera]XP_031256717.1 protein WHAT'S THIS FACTOR 9, mitochondrial [Pistacia vera]XP_031256718.1 protein WHAT'S THIS FACTOR 9, mitochondrial [Pistacia vera]XP_031256719.1 protein WHAT'S THIS FACTOR 9, mitochondrial [Pistacia vera]XP_031256720.1 protein WHAT'S THIS FACTOR 9, mitochondrial [Pista